MANGGATPEIADADLDVFRQLVQRAQESDMRPALQQVIGAIRGYVPVNPDALRPILNRILQDRGLIGLFGLVGLTFAAHLDSAGVVLIRFPSHSRKQLREAVTLLVEEYGDRLSQAFVVLRPGSVRISAIPR